MLQPHLLGYMAAGKCIRVGIGVAQPRQVPSAVRNVNKSRFLAVSVLVEASIELVETQREHH